jgi:hypothetical protein
MLPKSSYLISLGKFLEACFVERKSIPAVIPHSLLRGSSFTGDFIRIVKAGNIVGNRDALELCPATLLDMTAGLATIQFRE